MEGYVVDNKNVFFDLIFFLRFMLFQISRFLQKKAGAGRKFLSMVLYGRVDKSQPVLK